MSTRVEVDPEFSCGAAFLVDPMHGQVVAVLSGSGQLLLSDKLGMA